MTIDPQIDPYVLEGRIVTMGMQGIIDDGGIYKNNGIIEAVKPANAPPPAGYENAEPIRTGKAFSL